jgi:predicted NUDIX family phosphoesterase
MSQDEQILVVEREKIERIGMFHGLNLEVQPYLDVIFSGVPQFKVRSEMETNPAFKQLIPYVIMRCSGKYLTYLRGKRAGEKRLVGNRSIGIGGHINPVDDMSLLGFRETYLNAVKREVEEEVNLQTPYTDRIAALLNDDTNEVGQVHLGVVHLWTLDSENVSKNEQMINQLTFMSLDELQAVRDEMETWSQLCLDGLNELERCEKTTE